MGIAGRELLENLNNQQRSAVECTEGPLLVLAGAGTGKTKVITTRIAYLLQRGVSPSQILAVTFTRKAAAEMKNRISELLGHYPYGLSICTFHSLGFRILRELTVGPLRVLDEKEQFQLAESLVRRFSLDLDPARALFQISRAKNSRISPGEVRSRAGNSDENGLAECYAAYRETLRSRGAIDLDDMIALPLERFDQAPSTRAFYRKRWRYILVDEYQDTNLVQYELMGSILGAHSNICVVGDDDQSIYGFRGATVERILSFKDDFPRTTAIALEMNYRSHQEIISLANSIISRAAKRYPKRLTSSLGPGGRIEWRRLTTEDAEAASIGAQIRSLTGSEQFSFRDIAIIARLSQTAELFRRAFKQRSIPCSVGKTSSVDDSVSIMTLHQAKGLEFPVVFVPALEDDILPHYHALQEGTASIEEERRLFYVAVTRAKKRLFLSASANRNGREHEVSRFLRELPLQTPLRWHVERSRFTPFTGKV